MRQVSSRPLFVLFVLCVFADVQPAVGQTLTGYSTASSAQQRTAEYAQARAAYGEEIGMVAVWAERVAETFGIAMAAPNPLLGQAS